jgi:ribokinase
VHCGTLPFPGETVVGGDLLTFAGGKGANQAVAAARAGAKALFIGAFGDDAFGQARRAELEKEGVDCSGCVVKKGVPSGVALIAIGEGKRKEKAENLIVVAPGANARLTAQDVRRAMPKLTNEDVVLCCLEVPFAAVREAFAAARKAGALAILNPAPLPASGVPKSLLEAATVVTPNESEARGLLGGALGSAAVQARMLKLMNAGCVHVVVTRGASGVGYYHESCTTNIPAPRVKPVDTVGAGDCFNGCLAAYLVQHPYEIEDAIRYAVTAAAIKVTRHGAQAGMPYGKEIRRMMARAP